MKLNLGCGLNRLSGWTNVDASPACGPDEVVDLEATPWPWPSDSVEAALFHHSLEHMGERTATFMAIIQELYRVCRDGATIRIDAPHPRHDDFLNDPTHVRPITPQIMQLFDRAAVLQVQKLGGANTPLSLYLDVDFELARPEAVLDEPYRSQLESGVLSRNDVQALMRSQNNVVKELRMELRVHKPPRPGPVSA